MSFKRIPEQRETYDALTVTDDGVITFLAAKPNADNASFEANLIPWYTLSDRGTYFVPGSAKKTAKEQVKKAPHLFQHDTWEPIGNHAAAYEDDNGFRIAVNVNEGTQRGAELMSNLRFGVPLGVSVGFDTVADRSGTDADDAKLNRKAAPDFFKSVPVNELRAITEFRWWESSSVTFPGIGTAKPDVIHSASVDYLASLLTALKDGTATPEQLAAVQAIVAAHKQPAALPEGGTDELAARRRKNEVAAALARHAELLAQGCIG
jgi:HK97 family phage prohead protease